MTSVRQCALQTLLCRCQLVSPECPGLQRPLGHETTKLAMFLVGYSAEGVAISSAACSRSAHCSWAQNLPENRQRSSLFSALSRGTQKVVDLCFRLTSTHPENNLREKLLYPDGREKCFLNLLKTLFSNPQRPILSPTSLPQFQASLPPPSFSPKNHPSKILITD